MSCTFNDQQNLKNIPYISHTARRKNFGRYKTFRKASGEACLLNAVMEFRVPEMRRTAWLAGDRLASQEGLWSYSYYHSITLDNRFQTIFCLCDEYVINLFVCIYEVRKGT